MKSLFFLFFFLLSCPPDGLTQDDFKLPRETTKTASFQALINANAFGSVPIWQPGIATMPVIQIGTEARWVNKKVSVAFGANFHLTLHSYFVNAYFRGQVKCLQSKYVSIYLFALTEKPLHNLDLLFSAGPMIQIANTPVFLYASLGLEGVRSEGFVRFGLFINWTVYKYKIKDKKK